jgi:hypothetical protein
MLVERDVALWDAVHYKDQHSTGKNASKKDPVTVILKIPEKPEMSFYGNGRTIDEAVVNAFCFPYNRDLLLREGGLRAAMIRLEDELWKLWLAIHARTHHGNLDDDDDIPF